MNTRIIIPLVAAGLAAGGAALSLNAQDPKPQRKFEFRFDGDPSQMEGNFRRMLEGMNLGDEAKKQFEDALEQWRENGGKGPFQWRFEQDGGSPPTPRTPLKGTPAPDDFADPFEEMERRMNEMMGGDPFGSPFGGFDDLFRELRRRQGGGTPDAEQDPHDGMRQLQDLMRRMQQGGQGAERGMRSNGTRSRFSKHHTGALAEWRPLIKTARESTVAVMRDNRQIALGTIVSGDGYALTKASEVGKGELECQFQDGRIVPAKVVDKLESYDLALIKLEATGLKPAVFSTTDLPIGTLIAAVGGDEDPLATGIVSAGARNLSDKGKGALGIGFADDDSGKGVLVGRVIPGCSAANAGIKQDDVILTINGIAVDHPAQLQRTVLGMRPGDEVKVRYLRDGKEAELSFPLGSREDLNEVSIRLRKEELEKQGVRVPENAGSRRFLDPTALMGSALSDNATGYPSAVQSDLTIDANDCGGPVVDVDGNIAGIAIARAERVSTFIVPGKVLKSVLADVASGRYAFARDADTLKSELTGHEAAVRKAQQALKDAEAKRAAAEESLRKLER